MKLAKYKIISGIGGAYPASIRNKDLLIFDPVYNVNARVFTLSRHLEDGS